MGKGIRHLNFFPQYGEINLSSSAFPCLRGEKTIRSWFCPPLIRGENAFFNLKWLTYIAIMVQAKCHLLRRNRCLWFIMWSSLAYRYRASRIQLSWVDTRFEEKIIIFGLCRVSYGEGGFGAVSEKLYSVLTRLQMGLTQDKMDWTVELRQKTYWSENQSFTPPLQVLQITINPLVDC